MLLSVEMCYRTSLPVLEYLAVTASESSHLSHHTWVVTLESAHLRRNAGHWRVNNTVPRLITCRSRRKWGLERGGEATEYPATPAGVAAERVRGGSVPQPPRGPQRCFRRSSGLLQEGYWSSQLPPGSVAHLGIKVAFAWWDWGSQYLGFSYVVNP